MKKGEGQPADAINAIIESAKNLRRLLAERDEEIRQLKAALARKESRPRLTDADKLDAFQLVAVERLTYRALAERLGMTIVAATSRALDGLRLALDDKENPLHAAAVEFQATRESRERRSTQR